MPSGFSPQPVYPFALDSNYTLFLVYNTTESTLSAANQSWADEIDIRPVGATDLEIWPSNGFATISGEILYYDSVATDSNGKVCTLRQCIRNLGGTKTQYNFAGTDIRGFIMAEHHNTIAKTILRIENFVGQNFSPLQSTLDWRIRNLQAVPVIFDDVAVDLTLSFAIISSNPASGTVASYNVQINGPYNNYILSFGDGNSTTDLSGTYTYAPNAKIDPVATVSNPNSTVAQTPSQRITSSPTEPSVVSPNTDFFVPIPECPDIPALVIPEINTPNFTANFPPLVLPLFDLNPLGPINIPSVVVFEPAINIPSLIEFGPINIPSEISINGIDIPSIIGIENPDIPSLISFNATIPSVITFSPVHIPTVISVNVDIPTFIHVQQDIPTKIYVQQDIPTFIHVQQDIPTKIYVQQDIPTKIYVECCIPTKIWVEADIPTKIWVEADIPTKIWVEHDIPTMIYIEHDIPTSISIDWSPVPVISCIVTVNCPSPSMAMGMRQLDDEFRDGFTADTGEITANDLGIPSEIKLVVPTIPDIKLSYSGPLFIDVRANKMPTLIELRSLTPIPEEIKVLHNLPDVIELRATDIPTTIFLKNDDIPEFIELRMAEDMQQSLKFELVGVPESIQLVGAPTTIQLVGNIPTTIQLVMPEKPEIEMVYRGDPISVKVKLDMDELLGESEDQPCFALVPCRK